MSSNQTLGVNWGGLFLNSTSALAADFNWCSHSCQYCFANLNKPDRKANVKQAFNLLSELWQTNDKEQWKRQTYTAHLLREGYPVVLSNHVDPLASSNAVQALPFVEALTALDIPVSFMTKWGKRRDVDHLFDLIDSKPSSIYVSVATLNPDIVRVCEPGAPLPEERLQYIREAVSRGHAVNAGINPVIPGWIDDPDAIAKALKDAGVHGVYIAKLHLSCDQIKNIPERGRVALTEEVIEAGKNHAKHAELNLLYQEVREACRKVGLSIYDSQQREASDFFEPGQRLYSKKMPLLQDFVNHCHTTKQAGDLIFWEEFRDFFVPLLPTGTWGLRDHLNAVAAANSLNGLYIPQRMDYEELLWHCWQHTETILCPANVDCFAWAGDPIVNKRNTWIRVEDENQMPILVFLPEGTNNQAYTNQHGL